MFPNTPSPYDPQFSPTFTEPWSVPWLERDSIKNDVSIVLLGDVTAEYHCCRLVKPLDCEAGAAGPWPGSPMELPVLSVRSLLSCCCPAKHVQNRASNFTLEDERVGRSKAGVGNGSCVMCLLERATSDKCYPLYCGRANCDCCSVLEAVKFDVAMIRILLKIELIVAEILEQDARLATILNRPDLREDEL